jgi:hypothetical protein
MIRRHFIDIPVHKSARRIMGEQQASAKLVETDAVRLGLCLSSITTMLSLATTFGQVRCKIKGPNCGRLAIKRHTMSFDAMNREVFRNSSTSFVSKGMKFKPLRKKMVLGVILLPMINSFTILSIVSFHNLLICCPCSGQVGARKWLHTSACSFGRNLPPGQC